MSWVSLGPVRNILVTARQAGALKHRLPAVRNSCDKTIVITRRGGMVRFEETDLARNAYRGVELTAPDDTTIISEVPNTLLTIGVTCCLAIALVDVTRQAGALVHTYFAEQFEEPLQFALDALNARPQDLHIGLSGVVCTFGEKDAQIKAGIVAGIGRYGPIIYDQMGKRGDIAINFMDRTIHSPYHIAPPAMF